MATPAFLAWKLAYQISPILLTGGIATNLGGALPIVALTEGANFLGSLLSRGSNIEMDMFFANYQPMAGGTLINNQIATYPFANQNVAANAIIAQPLNISMAMLCPAKTAPVISGPDFGGLQQDIVVPLLGGYSSKLAIMMALQNTLAQHNNQGGTYTIVTPSYIYTYCVMTGMRDISALSEHKQAQFIWQLDFVQPLVSIQSAQTALNGLMQKLTNGTAISGTPTWGPAGLAVGNPVNLIASSFVPQPSLQ